MGQETMVNIKVSWTCAIAVSSGLLETLCISVQSSVKIDFCSFENFPWNVHLLIISAGQEIKTTSDSLLPK